MQNSAFPLSKAAHIQEGVPKLRKQHVGSVACASLMAAAADLAPFWSRKTSESGIRLLAHECELCAQSGSSELLVCIQSFQDFSISFSSDFCQVLDSLRVLASSL